MYFSMWGHGLELWTQRGWTFHRAMTLFFTAEEKLFLEKKQAETPN
jgi:hypothetical protein